MLSMKPLYHIQKMKERLKRALERNEKVKLVFEYPRAKSAKIRRGKVIKIKQDAFDFQEIKDGFVTYKYKYLVEVV